MATHEQLQVQVAKMRKLNLSLLFGVMDAIISYFVIMVQFDLANRRTKGFVTL